MGDTVVSMQRAHAPSALEVSITGKLVESRRAERHFYSTLLIPGPDEYSSAVPFEVRSERKIGENGEVVSVRCFVGGYFKKTYEVDDVDPRTGEVRGKRKVRPIVNTLDVIH